MNSHAAFSASDFEAIYMATGPAAAPLVLTASTSALFQSLSVKARGTAAGSRTATTEDVSTKRFTLLPCFKAEVRIDVVPRTAGVMISECIAFGKRRREF